VLRINKMTRSTEAPQTGVVAHKFHFKMRFEEDVSATTPSALFSERNLFLWRGHPSSRGGESASIDADAVQFAFSDIFPQPVKSKNPIVGLTVKVEPLENLFLR